MAKEIILSGYQPSGRSHIGNYLGAIRNFVELQKTHTCYFFIADYHSLMENYDPKQKEGQILGTTADFLAAGVSPKKATLFIQSDIPEHMELCWIFNTVVPVSHLLRMTQYKDKASRQKDNINMGLLSYPVLQAADILMYKAHAVPVGSDQVQHLELTKTIARLFNKKFGKTFPEPRPILTETPRIMSLLEPEKKMSKSLGDKHCIYLDDEPKEIKEKLKRAVTDTGDGKSTGANNLLGLLKEFGDKKTYQKFERAKKSGQIQYAELKDTLADAIADYFADFRSKKKTILNNRKKLIRVMDHGGKRARKIAKKTLAEVRQKIGIEYK